VIGRKDDPAFLYFPTNYRWSMGLLICLSGAPWVGVEIDDVQRVGRALEGHLGDDNAWFDEWTRMGDKIEARGRTSRPASPSARKQQTRVQARERRLNTPPTWKSSTMRAALASVLIFAFMYLLNSKIKDRLTVSMTLAGLAFLVYVPAGYYLGLLMYRRRQRRNAAAPRRGAT